MPRDVARYLRRDVPPRQPLIRVGQHLLALVANNVVAVTTTASRVNFALRSIAACMPQYSACRDKIPDWSRTQDRRRCTPPRDACLRTSAMYACGCLKHMYTSSGL